MPIQSAHIGQQPSNVPLGRPAGGVRDLQRTGIVLAEVLNAAWMVWWLVVARRMPDREPASLGR